MAKPRRSRRTLTTVLVLVLVSLTVITLDQTGRTHSITSGVRSLAGDVFTPLRSGVNRILDPIGNVFAGAVHYSSVVQENHELQAELGQVRQQDAESGYQEQQLRQLQRLLATARLPYLDQLPLVTAQQTGMQQSNFANTITIDKGRDDGVDVGFPVVGAGGLVGQVTFASHHSATVTLLTDGSFKVGVTFGANSATATLNGQGPGRPLSADFIPPGTVLRSGERMYTNSLAGNDFPAGIPVAYVTGAHTVSGASQESVTLRPLADLRNLAYVDVVQWSPTP